MQTLLQRLSSRKTIERAWNVVKKNRGVAPGIDQVTVDLFEKNKEANITKIIKDLRSKKYSFQPARKKAIPKSSGKGTRNIHIFALRDKVVQQALQTIFISNKKKTALFPDVYNEVGIAYIPKTNGVKKSVDRIRQAYKDGFIYLSTLDIQDFFDKIPGTQLYTTITKNLPDNSINWLIKNTIDQKVYIENKEDEHVSSVLQGAVLAPVYSNIYLIEFDKKIEQLGLVVVRYADDVAVLSRSSENASKNKELVRQALKETTNLEFYPDNHPTKGSKDRSMNQYAIFLGIRYSRSAKGNLSLSPSLEKIKSQKSKVDEYLKDEHYSFAENILRLNQSIQSWYSHYATCGCHQSPLRKSISKILEQYQSSLVFLLKKEGIILNKNMTNTQFQKLGVLKPNVLKKKKNS